jgi:hypothetical protein
MNGQETTTLIEEKFSFNWRIFILWPFVILLLYVLSLGPVVGMQAKQRDWYFGPALSVFYMPLEWTYEKTPLQKPLGMYLRLWAPEYFTKEGEFSHAL